MPRLTMEVGHSLGKAEATERLKDKFDAVRGRFGGQVSDLAETWTDGQLHFGFTAMRMKIAGTVTVGENDVKLAADLPLAALMLKGMIESRIREELGEILSSDSEKK